MWFVSELYSSWSVYLQSTFPPNYPLLPIIFREERRIRKWRKMIGVGGSDWKHYVRRKPNVVKRRIRKGIPDCLRGLVWQLISGSRDLLLMNPGVYEVLSFLLSLELTYCLHITVKMLNIMIHRHLLHYLVSICIWSWSVFYSRKRTWFIEDSQGAPVPAQAVSFFFPEFLKLFELCQVTLHCLWNVSLFRRT